MKIFDGDIESVDMYYRCELNIAFICDGCKECERIGLYKDDIEEMIN